MKHPGHLVLDIHPTVPRENTQLHHVMRRVESLMGEVAVLLVQCQTIAPTAEGYGVAMHMPGYEVQPRTPH